MTLRFYATESILIFVGDFVGVSKSQIIKRVTQAIALLRPQYIFMCNSVDEMEIAAVRFNTIARFPRTIGAH